MRMHLFAVAALAAAAAPAGAQQLGSPPPEFDAVKWYNSPALRLGDLAGKAVQIEVFRTW